MTILRISSRPVLSLRRHLVIFLDYLFTGHNRKGMQSIQVQFLMCRQTPYAIDERSPTLLRCLFALEI